MSLARRSVESSVYNVVSQGSQMAILFVRSVLLARLLTPEIFGAYAYVQAIIATTSVLPGFGLGAAFIHRSPESDDPKAPAVYLTMISLFTAIWGLALAAFGATWADRQRALTLWVLIASTFLANLAAPAQSILGRQVAFSRLALVNLARTVLCTVVALVLATQGAGIWSLLSIDLLGAVVILVGLYAFNPAWRPKLAWDGAIARYFSRFGGTSLWASILVAAIDRVDDLWTGWFLGDSALGFYSRAYTFANYPRRILADPVSSVAMGTYAEVKEDRKRLSQGFFKVNALIIRAGFLFSGALFLLSPELVRHLLGEQWTPMITSFRLMLAYTAIDPIKYTVGHLFVASGQPARLARIRVAQLGILVVGLVTLGPRLGIEGVALAATIMAVLGMAILLQQARRLVDFNVRRLFLAPTVAMAAGVLVGLGAVAALPLAGSDLAAVLVKAASFGLVYASIMLVIEKREALETFRLVKGFLVRRPKGVEVSADV